MQFERKPSNWPGWLWCIDSSGHSGWVPEAWVIIEGTACALRSDYSTQELNVNINDHVVGDVIESGWIRVQNNQGEWGWVPLECLSPG